MELLVSNGGNMGKYSKKGLYSAYDKNHKERDALDYYSTPTEEVLNILEVMQLDINGTILEPCCGGGHMVKGIQQYTNAPIIASDIKDRGFRDDNITLAYEQDYLSDDYPFFTADYVIMNPPFKLIEPFIIRSLEIAQKGILMFGRLQFLEGQNRYKNILKDNPPSDVWVYIDRVACFKNGDTSIKPDSVQAYAWYYWDKTTSTKETKLHWLWSKKHQ